MCPLQIASSIPKVSCAVAFACLAILALAGCDTPARRLEPKAVQSVQPGVTTRQEVLKDFGEPRGTLSGNGRTLLFYQRNYPGGRMGFGPTQPAGVVCFTVLFDKNDRVIKSHYSSRDLSVFASRTAPSVGSRISPEMVGRIKTGVTTRQEVVGMIGEPDRESLTLDGAVILAWDYWQAVLGRQAAFSLQLYLNPSDVVIAIKTINVP
jgi:outer membrane protein assembly factor BamE (lipoprotein component of BamABCDE complex)